MRSSDLKFQAATIELQRLIRARGSYAHVRVRERAGHLNIEVLDAAQKPCIVARATPIGPSEYGLSFCGSSGKYEPMPVSGSLDDVAEGLTTLLAPYLDPVNLR